MKQKKSIIVIALLLLCGAIALISAQSAETFTVIVLPDTQNAVNGYPEIVTNQTQWIINNKELLNIKMVIHVGDVVNNPTVIQFDDANASLSLLDGEVSWLVVPGNHDYHSTFLRNLTLYDTYFNYSRFEGYDYYGGHYGSANHANYGFFNVSGDEWIVLGMSFCPTDEEITWANDTLTTHESKDKIVFLHSYMFEDGTRVNDFNSASCYAYHGAYSSNYNEGSDVFHKMIKHHEKVRLVLSGHFHTLDGLGRRMDVVKGYPVNQVLQNYQHKDNGGNGFLRIYTFDKNNNLIDVKTYSPYLDVYNTTSTNQFELYWDLPDN